jgi:hypothetical protein
MEVFNEILKLDYLDLGLARNLIRSAKQNDIPELLVPLLDNPGFFTPVINDVVLYFIELHQLPLASASGWRGHIHPALAEFFKGSRKWA